MVDSELNGGPHYSFDQAGQCDPICFRVRFDAKVAERTMAFRGPKAFQSPSELVVPLRIPLKNATLRDLLVEYLFRVKSRHPQLSQSCVVDAFFAHTDSTILPPSDSNLVCEHFIRLDLEVNGYDALDCFFAPHDTTAGGVSRRPVAYDIIAHWRPNSADADDLFRKESTAADPCSGLMVTEPVVFPSARRDMYVTLPSLPHTAAVPRPAAPPSPIAARVAAITDATERFRAAQAERRALQSRALAARGVVAADERSARATLAEVERDDHRQIVVLQRLAEDAVPAGAVAPLTAWARRRGRPDDTQPLVDVPTAVPRADLAVRVEMTAWLSILFAAKGYKTHSGPALGEEDADELLSHYAEVRCDILAWERREFRELTSIMKRIIMKQRALVEESVNQAFRDEFARTSVLKFEAYEAHYAHAPALLCGSPTADSSSASETQRTSEDDQDENQKAQQLSRGGEIATCLDKVNAVAPSSLSEKPKGELPPSFMTDDEAFGSYIKEAKARAVAALEEINTIDMRRREPIALRIAMHRLGKIELEDRNTILLQEADELKVNLEDLQRTLLDEEFKALRAYTHLISPILEEEEGGRAEILEMEERRAALYASLHFRAVRRLEVLCQKEDPAVTDANSEAPQDLPTCTENE